MPPQPRSGEDQHEKAFLFQLPAHVHQPVVEGSFSVSFGEAFGHSVFALDVAVGDVEDAGAVGCDLCIVGDHEYSGTLGVQLFDLADDFRGGLTVQGSGRLIGEEDLRVVDHGSGDACALELAATDLVDVVVGDLDDAELSHQFFAAGDLFFSGFIALFALNGREEDVIHDGQVLHHEHLLEDESHVVQTDGSEFFFRKSRDIFSIKLDLAGCGLVHARDRIEESAFAGAGWAHDADHLAFLDVETDVLQDIVLTLLDDVCLAQIFYFH